MAAIAEKAKERARELGVRAKRDMERQLDQVLYYQMKKLEHKAAFMREFWQTFELERKDMQMVREELLAERVALTVLRSGELKGTPAERVLANNEFSAVTTTIRPITIEKESMQE